MNLHRHALSALVLFLGLPLGGIVASTEAQAGGIKVFWKFNAPDVTGSSLMRGNEAMVVVEDDPNNPVASVELRVRSVAGGEDLVLTESNAWLHGSAVLSNLPPREAALTVTLYNARRASFMTFSGALTSAGTVTLDEGSAPCDILSRVGCTAVTEYDVQFIGGEANFLSGQGYALSLDLAGADTHEVAYATVQVSGGEVVEVDLDAVGSVWTAESTLAHTGVIDLTAKSRAASGSTVDNLRAKLDEPWFNDGDGVNTLSAGSGTSVAVHRWGGDDSDGRQPGTWSGSSPIFTLVSEGWTTTSHPSHAEVELAGGETVTVPANSYQRRHVFTGNGPTFGRGNPEGRVTVGSGSVVFTYSSLADLGSPRCSAGTCITLVEGERGYELAATTYGTDAARLPDTQDFAFVLYDTEGRRVASETISVTYESAVTAVFASALEVEGDPVGGDASGSVRLLRAPGSRGRQDLLSIGIFYGAVSRDSDGGLGLGGYGTADWATSASSASILLGDPVACDGEGCNGDWAPPVVSFAIGGRVTKIVVSSGGLDYSI